MTSIADHLATFTRKYKKYKRIKSINLPRYRCNCYCKSNCSQCGGNGTLSYQDAEDLWGESPLPLGLEIPQCHICTKFETEDNELFAYSVFENEYGYKFIYRCVNGHGHDIGMKLVDVLTGLERTIK